MPIMNVHGLLKAQSHFFLVVFRIIIAYIDYNIRTHVL